MIEAKGLDAGGDVSRLSGCRKYTPQASITYSWLISAVGTETTALRPRGVQHRRCSVERTGAGSGMEGVGSMRD